MLKGIDPRIAPELLFALACLGHGDEIAVVDTNFPARSSVGCKKVNEMLGLSAPEVVALILRLVPLDSFVKDPCLRMEVVGNPKRLEPVQLEVQEAIDEHSGTKAKLKGIERFAFYKRAANAAVLIRSGERRFYGCFLFKVGVIPPDEK
jgi:L-fucose mutarotase